MNTGPAHDEAPTGNVPAARSYTPAEQLLANLPFIVMVGLGAAIFVVGMERSAWGWTAAAGCVAYGLAGTMWIILFLCPYCHWYGTNQCPCGYGQIAAKLRPRRASGGFARAFRRHIPVIVPLWLVPAVVAVIWLVRDFNWVLVVLLAAFVLDGYVLLPLLSRKHTCGGCPQRDQCPWMAGAD